MPLDRTLPGQFFLIDFFGMLFSEEISSFGRSHGWRGNLGDSLIRLDELANCGGRADHGQLRLERSTVSDEEIRNYDETVFLPEARNGCAGQSVASADTEDHKYRDIFLTIKGRATSRHSHSAAVITKVK